jgi:hypothetical protein
VELVNALPIPAMANPVPTGEPNEHRVFVTAKATFRIRAGGTQLERERPLGLFTVDEETELGLLPSDTLPRIDDAFEVFVLGQAHAPGGRPAVKQTISVSVGEVTRKLSIFGDRRWRPSVGGLEATPPEPYLTMPLVWDRAFGGRCDLWLDTDSPLEVSHPLNPFGRGFDPSPHADGLAKELRLQKGWPQVRYERLLPNLENPDRLVATSIDDPEPCCWATIPAGTGMTQLYIQRGQATLLSIGSLRAHPDWYIDRPNANAHIEMVGLHSDGPVRCPLPAMRLFVDHEEVNGVGHRELVPYRLFLFPEQDTLAIAFHAFFHRGPSRRPRRLRLRAEEGSCPSNLCLDGTLR